MNKNIAFLIIVIGVLELILAFTISIYGGKIKFFKDELKVAEDVAIDQRITIDELLLDVAHQEQVIQDQSELITKLTEENEKIKKSLMEYGF